MNQKARRAIHGLPFSTQKSNIDAALTTNVRRHFIELVLPLLIQKE
jgi:hypothetical protein